MHQPGNESIDDESPQLNLPESVYNASDFITTMRLNVQPDCSPSIYASSDCLEEREEQISDLQTIHLSSDQDEENASSMYEQEHNSEALVSHTESIVECAVLRPCIPCEKNSPSNDAVEASWYCKDCKETLCKACKSYHDVFKGAENHTTTSLHSRCDPCKKQSNVDAVKAPWYCNNCDEFLCEDCRSVHRILAATANHYCCRSYDKIVGQRTVPLRDCNAQYLAHFPTRIPGDNKEPNIVDCALLPNSGPLLVDLDNSNLKLFDGKFQLVTVVFVSEVPRRLSTYDGTELAVTTRENCILLFSLGSERSINLKKTLKLDIDCCGITYLSNSKFAVTGLKPGSYHVYDTTGKEISRTVLDAVGNELRFHHPLWIAFDKAKSHTYVSDKDEVIAIDTNTNTIVWRYRDQKLISPKGSTVDQEGNIYVCDGKSYNIHQVSPDSELIKIILCKSFAPSTSLFNSNDDTLIVGHGGGNVALYKMVQKF